MHPQAPGALARPHAAGWRGQAVCSGFVFGLATADNFIRCGQAHRALVIGAETFSRILDWNDRNTCVLFGDGAGAVVLEAGEGDGTAKDRGVTPKFSVTGLATSYDAATKSVRLRGVLKTDYPAHSVVVFDNVPEIHEAYWQKPYAARIGKDGQFEVSITEPSAKDGTLRLLFCFQNGAISGDSQTYGIASALEKPYRAMGGGYQLAP